MRRTATILGVMALAACGSDGMKGGVDGGPEVSTTCRFSVSGPVSVTGASCSMLAAHENATNETTIEFASLGQVPALRAASFFAVLGSSDLQARTYDVHAVHDAFAEVEAPDATLWFASVADPVFAYPDQGTFTVTISATGDAVVAGTDGKGWAPHGTLDATLPADREGTGQGTVTLHATF